MTGLPLFVPFGALLLADTDVLFTDVLFEDEVDLEEIFPLVLLPDLGAILRFEGLVEGIHGKNA